MVMLSAADLLLECCYYVLRGSKTYSSFSEGIVGDRYRGVYQGTHIFGTVHPLLL